MAKVVLSTGLGILSTFAVGWGGESRLYLISVRLEFKVVAKLGKLDAVQVQFEVEAKFIKLYVVIV